MIYILIENVRRCKIVKENETIRVGDNRMTDIKVEMPSTFGTQEYLREDCSVEMRCYISDNEYLGYTLDTSDNIDSVPVTTDLTEKVQDITISFVITHSGNVIGTTNSIILSVAYARNNGQELTPREEFDRVINEQRQTIATQQATIKEQTEQIAQDSEVISGLNTQVNDLTTKNATLAEQNSVYLDTIDELNKRVPAMETPLPVTPTGETQVIRPSENYAGLASVTVDRVTAAADPDIQPENIKEGVEILGVEGTYNPFPEQSYGGIYILEKTEDGYPVRVLIKDYYSGSVTAAGGAMPMDNNIRSSLKEFIVDEHSNITEAGSFVNCYKLTTVILPNVTSININGFQNCSSLTTITVPNVTSISDNGFINCSSLTTVILPNVTSIGVYVFANCSSLTTVILPNVTSIGTSVFANCSSLTTITVPNVTSIGINGFQNCSSLTTVILPNVTSIGTNGFQNCSSLTTVILPNVTSIGTNGFLRCSSLKTMHIPSALINLPRGNQFSDCYSLEFVTIEPGFNCNNLNLSSSTLYSVETIVSWLEALADRTGETAYTLTMGATNLNKLTDEQKAIAIGKNWNLA